MRCRRPVLGAQGGKQGAGDPQADLHQLVFLLEQLLAICRAVERDLPEQRGNDVQPRLGGRCRLWQGRWGKLHRIHVKRPVNSNAANPPGTGALRTMRAAHVEVAPANLRRSSVSRKVETAMRMLYKTPAECRRWFTTDLATLPAVGRGGSRRKGGKLTILR